MYTMTNINNVKRVLNTTVHETGSSLCVLILFDHVICITCSTIELSTLSIFLILTLVIIIIVLVIYVFIYIYLIY